MSKKILKNNNQLLDSMMSDLNKQNRLYKPGNYWSFYEKNIVKQIKKNQLDQFRNWSGSAGIGSIHSFNGGDLNISGMFGEYFHPFDEKFLKFDNNFFVKIYNRIINKLSKFFPFFSFFSFRAALGRRYFFDKIKHIENFAYDKIYNLDKELLLSLSDSKVGNPSGFYRNDKFYTISFLNELTKINFLRKNINFNEINSVVELGAGTGLLASALLQFKKSLKYIVVEIPPALYIVQNFLEALGYKTLGYNDVINLKSLNDINIDDYQVICLPSWKIGLLQGHKFDLFVNAESFQEMEPELTENYLNKISPQINKYIYLNNSKIGHAVGKKGEFGVLKQTGREHYLTFLKDNFKIKKERDLESLHGSSKDHLEIIFEKN
jgi:putative sugar O-methyltransferase